MINDDLIIDDVIEEPTDEELCLADLSSDGIVNVIDIVALVAVVLDQ